MGTVYAIANQKGGVGKTTTAVNLAACVAEAGYDALLVDIDPQCNATVGLGHPQGRAPERSTTCCCGAVAARATAIVPTAVEHLCDRARRARTSPARPSSCRGSPAPRRGCATRSRRCASRYAFTLLDCPPSLGPLTVNALVAADRVIVPCRPSTSRSRGSPACSTRSAGPARAESAADGRGMLLTMHDGRTRLAQDVEREVREHFPDLVFDTVIPRNVRVGEAPSFGKPVIHHDPHCAGADAYFELAKEVAARG